MQCFDALSNTTGAKTHVKFNFNSACFPIWLCIGITVVLISALNNFVVLFVIFKSDYLRKISNAFAFSVALSDGFLGTITPIILGVNVMWYDTEMCRLFDFCIWFFGNANFHSLLCATINRYISVRWPYFYYHNVTPTKSLSVLFAIWFFAFASGFLVSFTNKCYITKYAFNFEPRHSFYLMNLLMLTGTFAAYAKLYEAISTEYRWNKHVLKAGGNRRKSLAANVNQSNEKNVISSRHQENALRGIKTKEARLWRKKLDEDWQKRYHVRQTLTNIRAQVILITISVVGWMMWLLCEEFDEYCFVRSNNWLPQDYCKSNQFQIGRMSILLLTLSTSAIKPCVYAYQNNHFRGEVYKMSRNIACIRRWMRRRRLVKAGYSTSSVNNSLNGEGSHRRPHSKRSTQEGHVSPRQHQKRNQHMTSIKDDNTKTKFQRIRQLTNIRRSQSRNTLRRNATIFYMPVRDRTIEISMLRPQGRPVRINWFQRHYSTVEDLPSCQPACEDPNGRQVYAGP